MKNKGNVTTIILIVLLTLTTAAAGYFYLQTKNPQKPSSNDSEKADQLGTKCVHYGWTDGSESLPSYMVKRGDTLLSIAKDELSDSGRVEELIALNKGGHPSLSMQSPFIEQGWVLVLPPKNSKHTSGHLKQMQGELVDITGGAAWMIYSPGTGGTGPWLPSRMVASAPTELKKSDCVRMLYDETTGIIYSYELQ